MEFDGIVKGMWFISAGVLMLGSALGYSDLINEGNMHWVFIMGGCILLVDYLTQTKHTYSNNCTKD